jgi:hypothetical protein
MAEVKRRPPTIDELRHRIDQEGAGDKVPFPDPAASPLGTDDEAAGTPPTAMQRGIAAEHELRREGPSGRRPMGALWAMLLVIVLVLLAAWWALAAR